MRFIFHVGAHKTGSTLIQSTAYGSFAKDSIAPIFRSGRNAIIDASDPLSTAFAVALDNSYVNQHKFDEAVSALDHLIRAVPGDLATAVYSNENIFGALGHNEAFYDRAVNALSVIKASMIDAPEFILYVRAQPDWLISWFAQYSPLKRCVDEFGDTITFLDFLNMVDLESLSWLALAERIVSVFGEKSLTVVPFELIQKRGAQGYLDDFSKRTLASSPLPIGVYSHHRRGMSARDIAILHAIKPYIKPKEIGNFSLFLESLPNHGDEGRAYDLPQIFKDALLEAHLEGNREVFARFVPDEHADLIGCYQPATRTC